MSDNPLQQTARRGVPTSECQCPAAELVGVLECALLLDFEEIS